MKVIDKLRSGDGRIISVEIEPPNLGRSVRDVFDVLDPLVNLGIQYIDITYHPEQIVAYVQENGERFAVSQRKKPGTSGVAGAILGRYGNRVQTVPHVICTGFTRHATEEYLVELAYLGIENLMALRGDSPKGPNGEHLEFTRTRGGHEHANELIRQIVDLRNGTYVGAKEGEPLDFCVGAACYPEGYSRNQSTEDDLRWIKEKVQAGADYLVTQMFFDIDVYKRFVEKTRKIGIEVPIVPGLKPISVHRHLQVLPEIFGCSIPKQLADQIERYRESKDDLKKVGVDWCVRQCQDLKEFGSPSLHFYAARGSPIEDVVRGLS